MDLLQRLPKAILVTIVALLFFGGTVGVVVAAGEEPLPDEFGVASPHEGDRWEYRVDVLKGPEEMTVADGSTFGMEWLEADAVFDRDGTPRHVQPLQLIGQEAVLYVDMETKQGIAEAYTYDRVRQNGLRSGGPILGYPVYDVDMPYRLDIHGSVVGYGDEAVPCGVFTPLQDGMVPLDGPVRFDGFCPFDLSQGDDSFEAFEVRDWDGVQTVGFRTPDGDNATRLWYTPEIPYPVVMEFDQMLPWIEMSFTSGSGQGAGPQTTVHWIQMTQRIVMTGFQPGDVAWGESDETLSGAMEPLDVVPMTVTGPDDSGLEFPYLLSEAYESLAADPKYTWASLYFSAHPDAFVIRAEYRVDVQEVETAHIWWYEFWYDGAEQPFGVQSIRYIPNDPAVASAVTAPETYREEHEQENGDADFWVSKGPSEERPISAPRVVDAFARYEEVTGMVPDTYGFDHTCAFWCFFEGIDAVYVGHEEFVSSDDEAPPAATDRQASVREVFWFDDEGRLAKEERAETHSEDWASGALLLTGGQAPAEHADGSDVDARRPVWALPSPEATAGITFVAFLIGMAYWLWPAAKALPFFGMFSRVRADQMMDNPVRARIMEIIQQQPGIHYQALVREVGKGGSVVDHHLRKLHQGEHIVIQKGPGFTCMFPTGQVDHRIMTAVPALRTEAASNVLKEVLRQPGRSVTDVAQSLGIAKSTASYHVARLRKANLLGVSPKLEPTEDAKRAVAYAA